MNFDQDEYGKNGARSKESSVAAFRKKFTTKEFLFAWCGGLAVVVVLVAVFANFGLLRGTFKAEMADHWNPTSQGPAPVSTSAIAGSQAATLERTYNLIARMMNKVTVSITGNASRNGRPCPITGSGLIVAPQHVLTNLHVVDGAKSIEVTVTAPVKTSYPAMVVATDPANDLALLTIPAAGNLPAACLSNSDAVDAGDIVFAVGNPFGFANTITSGIVSDNRQTFAAGGKVYSNMFQTNTGIHVGSSGGPLVNISGEVIGINTAIYAPNGHFTGIGFAMPINRAEALLRHAGRARPQNIQPAAGCFATAPNCTLAATGRANTPSLQAAATTLGAMLRCPNCGTCRYVRCPTCRRRLVTDPTGTRLACPVGHAPGGSYCYHICPRCRTPMAHDPSGPFSLAA